MNIRAYREHMIALALAGAALLLQGCGTTGDRALSGPRSELVTAALSQVGTPYRLGGNSPREGLDCSGLTAYAHRAAGLKIPRMAADQRRTAKPIGERPGPGDLVFFRIPPGGEHVGLMVDGERFVHASTSRQRVQLARLDSPYWRRHYVGAGTYLH
jgi:cell wall-associated NlpC family hydrolase